MGMIIEPASKERTEQGEQFIERLLKILQNNDKVTVNIMYCQTCVIDSLASIDSGTSYNVNLGKDGYTVLNEMVYNSHQQKGIMDLYEILLQRLVFLTNEYLQLKERVRKLENEARMKSSTTPRIIKMRIDKAK